MSLLLKASSLAKSFGPHPLFRGISISFDDTERTGLIGANGSGKSTLLKILAGQVAPDSGTIESRRGLTLGYLAQQDVFSDGATVLSTVSGGLPKGMDEHERDTLAQIQLGKLGFDDFDQLATALSGGWRKRLALARELVRKPDLLLMDEPTNHLDLEGILWLEKLLANAPFAFIVVSHDRYFLENVSNRVVELGRAYADGYLSCNGTYSEFLVRQEEYLASQARNEQSLASQVRREIEWLKRGAKARTTKAKGRIEQAGQMMTDLAELKTRNNASKAGSAEVDFTGSDRQTRKLLAVHKISKSLGGRKLFSDLSLVLSPASRLGLLGPNGSGKTTLIKLLSGELEPDSGTIKRADNLQVVRFDQNRKQIDPTMKLRTALVQMGDSFIFRGQTTHVTSWAKRFLFRTEQLDMPVGDLSGGEQARVHIARLMQLPADVLILDEPTNDLDIATLDILEESLADFPGALVLVTHDRFMLDRVSTDILALDGAGGVANFADTSQWERAREAREQSEKEATAKARAQANKQAAKSSATPSSSKPRRLSYMEERELASIEAKIAEAEKKLAEAQARMEDRAVLADRNKLHDACTQVDLATQEVHRLFARWEELESRKV